MSDIILEARDIRYRYPRGMEAIRGISFHIRKGEKIALVGPNGAGKSTLLLMFNGMIRPDSGTILYDNTPIQYDRSSLRDLRKQIGYVLQNPDQQIIAPTVYQDVAFGPTNLGYLEEEVREAVEHALRSVGLENFERRPPHHLSSGEKKKVAIAGVLAMDPEVLIIDEPTSNLDPQGSQQFMELLDELNHQGKTVIISTHDIELVYPWADRAILLSNGRILQEDTPEVAFGNPECIRKAHLSVPILLEFYLELKKRGYPLPKKKPQTILDMLAAIESLVRTGRSPVLPGSITVCNVDTLDDTSLAGWLAQHPSVSIGAMGTRAKQHASKNQISLDYTYGVIDKCILQALRGEHSLILTTESMVRRLYDRIRAFNQESDTQIAVTAFEQQPSQPEPDVQIDRL